MSDPVISPNVPVPPAAPEPSAPPSARPSPPRPSRRMVDDEIERELEAALAGLDIQSVMEVPKRPPSAPIAVGAIPQPTGRKRGIVVGLHGDDVFIDAGGRSQGVLSLDQFPEGKPTIGQEVDVSIEGYDKGNGLILLSRKGSAVHVDWSTVAEGVIVEARVTGVNKGGLQVDVNGIRGFIPLSQVDLYRVEDVNQFLNQRLRCVVSEAKPEERNLVLSRRALLEKEREENSERLWNELAEGQTRSGIVRNIKEFGAFLDLGGVDGLLHVSDMSWSRVDKPEHLVQMGQKLDVIILKLDRERRKISVGLKQLLASPWDTIESKFPDNAIVSGKVTRLMDFGAFVELEPGIEGLIHISELSPTHVRRVGDFVKAGQDVQVKILKVDKGQRRIGLSLKGALPETPAGGPAEAEEPETPAKPLPPLRVPLRGGLGGR